MRITSNDRLASVLFSSVQGPFPLLNSHIVCFYNVSAGGRKLPAEETINSIQSSTVRCPPIQVNSTRHHA
jgi:hypothetical protein